MPSPLRKLNNIKDEEIDIFFDEYANNGDGRPWDSKEWEENRKEVIDDECYWCGKDDDDTVFQIHHYNEPDFDAQRNWQLFEDQLFIKSNKFNISIHTTEPDNCPHCLSTNFYSRKTKTPTYRCRRCDSNFHDKKSLTKEFLLTVEYPNVYGKTNYYHDKLSWVEENRDRIQQELRNAYDKHWEKYFSMENTITICQGCHYMHHEHNKKVCSECNEEYGDYRDDDDIEDYVCWDCLVDIKGLAICKECGDNWYNPSYTSMCSSCRR